jgi:hypothetical protein
MVAEGTRLHLTFSAFFSGAFLGGASSSLRASSGDRVA